MTTNDKGATENKAINKEAAYKLRLRGKSYREIGRLLDIHHVTAFNYVKQTLDEIRERTLELAHQYREMELARLDEAQDAIYAKVLAGDPVAIDRFLRIQDRRSKYLGLDSPTQIKADITMPEPIQFILAPEKKDA